MIKTEDFIRKRIREDLEQKMLSYICTRFPPEPNGYLHIGHAKSIMLNFGIAKEFQENCNTHCNLRFDDTNPEKEDIEYIQSIKDDLQWLGCNWENREYFASDYFSSLYEYAIILIKKGLAYVDHSSPEEMKKLRGTPTKTGMDSPYRNREIEENLLLFEQMKNGKIKEGVCLLRAKVDMKHSNLVMRDPAIYRIRNIEHHRKGREWCIYPMYDFAHCLSDSIEHVTHSLCTMEFENHRPLYEWFIQAVEIELPHPVQIEFSRLNITHTILSKRKMKMLVDKKYVDGWDDPRMPTISGLRRRGYTPESIRSFCEDIGITKTNSTIELARLEEALRQDLNIKSLRVMVVFDPVKLIINNYPEDKQEIFIAENNQANPDDGTHEMIFTKEIFIERDDIMENPPKGYFRIAIGQEVRLKYAYYITCTKIIKDDTGKILEVHANYDPKSRGGGSTDNRKVKGTIHWVSCRSKVNICVHMLDVLFSMPLPEQQEKNFIEYLNPNTLVINNKVIAEEYITEIISSYQQRTLAYPIQCLRRGYIMYDAKKTDGSTPAVFNFTVSLKDSWNKKQR